MQHIGETYLGDGIYASYDGYQIRLRIPREDADHFVYLDYKSYLGVVNFVKTANCFE